MESNQGLYRPQEASDFEEPEEEEAAESDIEADASDQYITDTEEEFEEESEAENMAEAQKNIVKPQKSGDQKVMFSLGKEEGSESAKTRKPAATSRLGKDTSLVKVKGVKDGDKTSVSGGNDQGQVAKGKAQAATGLRKQTMSQRSQANFQRRQQLVSQRSQVISSQKTGTQSSTQKSQIGIQKTTGVSQRSQVSFMKSQSSFQKKQTVTQKNSSGLQKSANAQRSTVNMQRSQGIAQRSQANFQRSQANFQKSSNDKVTTRSRVASAKVLPGATKRVPLHKSMSSPDTGDDERYLQKSSVSSDGDTSPLKLYQPKPTLKELAEAGSVAPRGKFRTRGSKQNLIRPVKSASMDYSLFDGKSPETIMKEYEAKEIKFHEQLAFLYESPRRRPSKKTVVSKSKIQKENVAPKANLGIGHLDNLLHVMEHLAEMRSENDKLQKKCNFLEDSRSLLNLQNQMLNGSRVKHMNKSESFISRAQSKVKHYLVSPIVHPSGHSYQRVHSDSGSGIPLEMLDSPKPLKSPKGLKRSTSVGSMEGLDLASPVMDRSHEDSHSFDKQNKASTMRKKVNKRFAKFTKMKRVFSKPESGSKLDAGAISAEEIIRVNKQKSSKPRPSSLAPSKSFDHGHLVGSLSDDNCGTTSNHLFVEPPRSSPPSPSSVKSEPGTAFPATTPVEPEPKELDKQTPKSDFVDIGDTQSVRTVVRTISQTENSYPAAGIDDRISLSDNDSEKSRPFEIAPIGYPLVRRKSSPTLRKHGSVDNTCSFGLGTPTEIRRSSSFKARPKRQLVDGDRSISNTAYITENLLSPEDAKRAQIQLRSKDGEVHKKAKAAWVKVKDIIHTRKDSIKKTRRRSLSGMEEFEISPEGSSWEDRITLQGDYPDDYDENLSDQDVIKEPTIMRSHTIKPMTSSPKIMRKRAASVKTPSELSCPIMATKRDSMALMSVAGAQVDVSALMGGLNEDFHKKMSEWEDKKKKGTGGKGDNTSPKMLGDTKFTEDFIRRMEQWEKIKGINKGAESSTSPPKCKESASPIASQSPPPVKQAELPIQAETVEHLSESFSKTVQEWERIKEKRAKEPDTVSHSGSSSSKGTRAPRRKERSKSGDRNPRDKSRQRYEREIQKREQKLEKERQKLDKMRQKLDNADYPPAGTQPADFLGKFYDWELLKNFNNALSVSGGEGHHTRSRSEKRSRDSGPSSGGRDRIFSDSSLATQDYEVRDHQGDLVQQGQGDLGRGRRREESHSLRGKPSEGNTETPRKASSPLVDDSTSIDVALTMETIAMLESANEKLSEELSDKEGDLTSLKHQVQELSDRIEDMAEQHHSDIEGYKRELWACSKIGHFSLESQHLTSSLKHLKQKLNELQEYGERVMAEKKEKNEAELSEKSVWSERETQLLEQIQALQTRLDQKVYCQGGDVWQTLYNYIINAQKQVHSLQHGVSERDHMISYLQQHVMVQEVYNHLMITELQRKDAILNFLKQQKKAGILRRWNTFHAQDLMLRQDGTIELKKIESDYPVAPPSVKRVKREYEETVTDRTDALQLHFDWIENIQQQIEDVKESQKADIAVQARLESHDMDCQTALSLLKPGIPLNRLQWDGSFVGVCDRGVQHKVTTADAAVLIEDVEVYERKQRHRMKLSGKGAETSTPEAGTVNRRREMFDSSSRGAHDNTRSHDKQARRSRRGEPKMVVTSGEEQGNRTVIGRKLLDFEHCQREAIDETDVVEEAKVLEAKPYQQFMVAFEEVEPVYITLRESTSSASSSAAGAKRRNFSSVSSTGSSDIEVSFTVLLNEEKEQLPVTLSEDENAKDLEKEKDVVFKDAANSNKTNKDQYIKCQFEDKKPDEVTLRFCSNSESDVHKIVNDTPISASVQEKTPSFDDVVDTKPPLSPIVRSKYSRPRLRNEKSTDAKPAVQRSALKHARRNNSAGDVEPTVRERTSSDSSTIHSKFGSTDVEETTAAKFSVNMEKYLIRPRGGDGIPIQEKVMRSFEAQPFSRDCLLRRSPVPAMRKPAVSAMHTLKTAEELMNDAPPKRGRSLSVPKEGMVRIFLKDVHSGRATPQSLPGVSPFMSRKTNAELLKDVTKRLSLPSASLHPDTYLIESVTKSTPEKRKALILEPVVFDVNRQVRPHSIISYVSESETSSPSESIWQKLVKPKTSSLPRERNPVLPSTETPPSRRSGPHFKLFSRQKTAASGSHSKKGTITRLCMHTVTLDTSESDSGSTQCLPDIQKYSDTSPRPSESPATPKKQRKMPFLDAKWLSRSKRFFKTSNAYRRARSESDSHSEADISTSHSNSMCDSSPEKQTSCDSNLDNHDVIARRAVSEEKVDVPLIQVHNDW